VSSPAERDQAQAAANAEKIRAVSPHMKYIERYSRGYGILDVTRDRAQCEFYHLPTVTVPDERQNLAVVYASEAGNNSLKTASAEKRDALAEPAPK
jgi:alkaline phosphatase D